MTQVTITPICPPSLLGEGPHWEEKDKCLIYVDGSRQKLHRYFPDSGQQQTLHLENVGTGSTVMFVIPIEGLDHEYIVGIGRTFARVKWCPTEPNNQTKKALPLGSVDLHDNTTRLNDAKCSPEGRLITGTMDSATTIPKIIPQKGTLYTLDSDLKTTAILDKVSIPNGLAWNKEGSTVYFAETYYPKIFAFDYDKTTGAISNQRVVLDFKNPPGVQGRPDGLCIDTNENLWVACYEGYQVICVDPRKGKVLKSISIPSQYVTSCCWGGPDYATLYVTSASHGDAQNELNTYPDSGKTFSVTGLDAKGLPAVSYKLNLTL